MREQPGREGCTRQGVPGVWSEHGVPGVGKVLPVLPQGAPGRTGGSPAGQGPACQDRSNFLPLNFLLALCPIPFAADYVKMLLSAGTCRVLWKYLG